MASIDICQAYRHIPIHPSQRSYQGFRWMFGQLKRADYDYFVDNFLCFGLSCAPGIFSRISDAIQRRMAAHGYQCVNYLDDYCIIHSDYSTCQSGLMTLIHLLISLGFSISWRKVFGPCQIFKFLGITLDSLTMQARLPQEKLDKLHNTVSEFISKKRATKRQLARLAGVLSFCSSVVKGGRCFSRRVIDLVNSLSDWNYFTRLNEDFHKDLHWWLTFAAQFNGSAKLIIGSPMPINSLQSDACMSGFGVYYNGLWLCGTWRDDVIPLVPDHVDLSEAWSVQNISLDVLTNINYLELYPMLLAARRWGHMWCNQHIVLYSDNMSTVSFINRGTCRSKVAMCWLREVAMLSVKYNFHLTSRHLPGIHNVIADSLSRLHEPGQWERVIEFTSANGIPFFLCSWKSV